MSGCDAWRSGCTGAEGSERASPGPSLPLAGARGPRASPPGGSPAGRRGPPPTPHPPPATRCSRSAGAERHQGGTSSEGRVGQLAGRRRRCTVTAPHRPAPPLCPPPTLPAHRRSLNDGRHPRGHLLGPRFQRMQHRASQHVHQALRGGGGQHHVVCEGAHAAHIDDGHILGARVCRMAWRRRWCEQRRVRARTRRWARPVT